MNEYIGQLQTIVGAENNENFLEDLRSQNKLKVWNFNPIILSTEGGIFTHNADDIEKAVKQLGTTLRESLATTDSIDDVLVYKDNLKVVSEWLVGTRKEVTAPMDVLKKSFTANEKILKDLVPIIKAKEDELLEKVYAVRLFNIEEEFILLNNELIIIISQIIPHEILLPWINEKKKTKTYDLNKSEKLSAAAKKAIKEQFDLVANPLIEAKKLADAKESEQRFLTKEISNVSTTGTNEVLEASVVFLGNTLDEIEELYPNIKESAKSQVTNMISIVKRAIASNDRVAKENEQNEKDLVLINNAKSVDINSSDMQFLQLNYDTFMNECDVDKMLSKNSRELDFLLDQILSRISELKQKALTNVHVPIVESSPIRKEEIPVVEDVPRGTNEEVNEEPFCADGSIYEEEQSSTKIVNIKAVFNYSVPFNTDEQKIIDKVKYLLNGAGLSDALKSIEVI